MKEFIDACNRSKVAKRCLDLCNLLGIRIEFYEGVGAFSDPPQKVIRIGNGNPDMVSHFVYHVPSVLKRHSFVVVDTDTLKQMAEVNPSGFCDKQVALNIYNMISCCKLRNSYHREVGLKEIPIETELYKQGIWGGFRSNLQYLRATNSMDRVKNVPKGLCAIREW